MSKYILWIFVWFGAITITQAQQHHFNWKLGVHTGVATYFGDLSHQFIDMPHQFRQPIKSADFLSYGLSLEHHFSKVIGLRLGVMRHQITANDRSYETSSNYARALNVQTDLYEANLLATIYLDNGRIFGEKAVISPYFLFGAGLTYFNPKGDLLNENGSRYYYWADNSIKDISEFAPNAASAQVIEQDYEYETALRPLSTEGFQYQQITWNVAAGLGLKFRLSKRFYLHLEAIIRYTGSDYLDDVRDEKYLAAYNDNFQAYAAKPAANQSRTERGNSANMNDWYSNVGLSLHYSFGQKTFKIRPSIIYTNTITLQDTTAFQVVSANSKKEAVNLVKNENSSKSIQDTITVQVIDTVTMVVRDTILSPVPLDTLTDIVVNTPKDTLSKKQNTLVAKDTLALIKVDSTKEIISEKDASSIVQPALNATRNEEKEALVKQMYEYELRLQKLQYESKLREQDLLNQLKKENPTLATQKMEQDYQIKIQTLEKELLKKDKETALQTLELKHSKELDAKDKELELLKKTQAIEQNYQQKIQVLEKEIQKQNNQGTIKELELKQSLILKLQNNKIDSLQKNYDYESKLKNQSYEQQLELMKLQQQYELEKAKNKQPVRKDTFSYNDNSPKETESSTPNVETTLAVTPTKTNTALLVDSSDMSELRFKNKLLRLQIQELEYQKENLLATNTKIDTIYKEGTSTLSNNTNDEKLLKELELQRKKSADLTAKIEQLNAEKQQGNLQIDNLTAKIKLLESGEKTASNELQNFLAKGQSTYVTKIFFDIGKSSLTIQAKETMSTLINQLKNYPKVSYLVKGFASKTGNSEVNQRLSTERANAVSSYLKELNIDPKKISRASLGDKESSSANELDRRAEIHLSYQK